jgi:phosphomannomutase
MSGTEPLLRMYAEAADAGSVDHILEGLTATLNL